jgi:hypothetical protein
MSGATELLLLSATALILLIFKDDDFIPVLHYTYLLKYFRT